MAEIGKGRYDHRIGAARTDEFGLAFRALDAMAKRLQQRHDPPSKESKPPTLNLPA